MHSLPSVFTLSSFCAFLCALCASVVSCVFFQGRDMNPLVVGVLGGIGAGKSEVAAALASRSGGRVLVADTLGHEALRRPEIRDALVSRLGDSILRDGEIDRRRLAAMVFANKDHLAYLESLVHPWIRHRLDEEAKRAREERVPLLVIDAALLLEAGWRGVCDRLVFVDAPPEVRLERVKRDRGWSAEDARRREAAQLPLTRKRSVADHIIDNSSSHESLVHQVDDLLDRWGLPREPAPPAGGPHDAV
jgi:dephospho-CoA kinase